MANRRRHIESAAQSIGETFSKPFFYRVPVYQRDFAWTSEEVDVLWDDLTRALDRGLDEYFLGATVLSDKSEKIKEIVDGQQRLVCLSMIFSVIVEFWRGKKDEKRASGVFRDYLGTEDRRTGEIEPKIRLNENNDATFQALVVENRAVTPRTLSFTDRLMYDASKRIKAHFQNWIKTFSNDEAAALDLDDFIAHRVNLIVIETGSESDAFTIFETLNDRGLDLAPADLIKNYLFSLANGHLDWFKRAWADMSLLIGSDQLTPFLRHYWLSEYDIVRERELYGELRREVRSPTKARQLLEQLRRAADLYAALTNPEHAYWADQPPETREYLDALLLFGVTQYRPLALAGMEKLEADAVQKLFRLITVISFRYAMISSLGAGNLERMYARAAKAVRGSDVTTAKEIFQIVKSAYVADERFRADFVNKDFTKPSLARYILSQLNDELERDVEKTVAERSGRITLEHIFPKKPAEGWKLSKEEAEEMELLTDTVGNLTLLEKGKNRGIANATFDVKKNNAFSVSSLILNKELLESEKWDAHAVRTRSKRLADAAIQLWRLDY